MTLADILREYDEAGREDLEMLRRWLEEHPSPNIRPFYETVRTTAAHGRRGGVLLEPVKR